MNYLDYSITIPYGSHLYGTAHADSDIDLLTLYCESEADLFSARTPYVSRGSETDGVDERFMPMSRFVTLLAKGDPHWSIIAMQYQPLRYLSRLLVSAHTVGRMISFAHYQVNKSDKSKERAHGFRTALAAFDLFTTGDVKYPMSQADTEVFRAIKDGVIHGAEQTLGVTDILTELTISDRLRPEPNTDLAAEETMLVYQQVWERRRLNA